MKVALSETNARKVVFSTEIFFGNRRSRTISCFHNVKFSITNLFMLRDKLCDTDNEEMCQSQIQRRKMKRKI